MNRPEELCIEDYDYSLPDGRIAKYPLPDRDQSKLLIYRKGLITKEVFSRLPELLPAESTLAVNTTRVIHARLQFRKPTGSLIEIFCLEPWEPADYERAMQSGPGTLWKCLVGNKKKWKSGLLTGTFGLGPGRFQLMVELVNAEKNAEIIRFTWDPPDNIFADILDQAGTIPIPPYLNRPVEASDNEGYQTVYAQQNGSVAAPTAGLHFTPDLINRLTQQGFKTVELILHVGAGTFKPVKSTRIGDHAMHTEHFLVDRSMIESLINGQGPVISVGTTSVRTLESLYWLGVKIAKHLLDSTSGLFIDQWEPYSLPRDLSKNEALQTLLAFMDSGKITRLEGTTRIIIVPGYKFRMINGLITNYHQPHSTLLLLVAAFIGEDWKKVYQFALEHEFRFLSYGDSSLLLP